MKPTVLKPIKIVLIEDNEGDILLTTELFKEGKLAHYLFTLKDGQSAIKYLEKKDEYSQADTPDLILLDINLPKINGLEVLQHIRKSDHLQGISVCMLSSSDSAQDIHTSKTLGADFYFQKPLNSQELVNAITQKGPFWLNLVKIER